MKPLPSKPNTAKAHGVANNQWRGNLFGLSAHGLEGLALAPQQPGSVADQVHEVLRRAIVEVRLAPGMAISENALSKQFAVSRTPVRAAIQRLSEEGLIDILPQRGSYVAPLHIEQLHSSHFIRRSLELALLQETVPIWNADMSARLRAIVAEQERALHAADPERFLDEDERFHRELASCSGRPGVWPAIQAAKVPLTRFYRFWAQAQRLPAVLQEHLAIVEALDQGDMGLAQQALTDHINMVFVLFEQMPEAQKKLLLNPRRT